MQYNIRRATIEDSRYVAPRVRKADRNECEARLGWKPEVVLPLSVTLEEDVWTFIAEDGTPVGMMGVSPVYQNDMFGMVWMVTTDDVYKYRRSLLTDAPKVLDMLHDKYPLLGNHVDARNTAHIRWLKRMGFSMLREMPNFGVQEITFIEFAKLRID